MANIGIDFGTTNSLMVAYDKAANEFTYFNFSLRTPVPTSSTVWYHDGTVEVGKVARDNINTYGDVEGHHFEKSIKLKLGTGQHLDIFGKAVSPYEVAGTILSSLKIHAIKDWHANESGVDLSRAVFTIPINFSGKARRDLRKSANEAGIEVITFIHEPFAAIVGYLFSKYSKKAYREVEEKLAALNNQYILTFDWGGGTLDITVVQVQDRKMLELGTAELTNIAGDRFDEYIARYAWNWFIDRYGHKYTEGYLESLRKKKWDRLLMVAEQCKIRLSQHENADFILERITSNEDIDFTITREIFGDLISNALDAACNKIDEAIHQAGIQDIDLSHVLLTGGTCYIPAVQDRLREKFDARVENVQNADLVIAQGAAVIAEMGWLPFLTKDTLVELSDGSYWPIFESGMPIAVKEPAQNSEIFTCVDQRLKRAKVIVCEGIGQQKHKNLAVLNVPLLGDNRFGDDIVVEAELDKDIVLTVRSHSKMVHGYERDQDYAIRKSAEISQLCFGLDFRGEHNA